MLEFGLPDWKQPVFYYRKVRKLGLLEAILMIFMFITVGHVIFVWVAYLENKYEIVSATTSILHSYDSFQPPRCLINVYVCY